MNAEDATPAGGRIDQVTDPPASDLDRRPAISALDLPRLIGGVLTDIRAIAEGMAVLPALLTTLQGIERRVDVLQDEVHKMRTGVDGMSGDVDSMKDSLARVEPHLEDVSRITHPLRRLKGRGSDSES